METSHLGTEFTTKILQAFNEGQMMAYRALWHAGMAYLVKHLLGVTLILTAVFAVAFTRALFGNWGMLGSFLYRFLFLGALLCIGIIWGSEIFANNYVGAGLILLGIVCYSTVGWILRRTGLKM